MASDEFNLVAKHLAGFVCFADEGADGASIGQELIGSGAPTNPAAPITRILFFIFSLLGTSRAR